MVIYRGSIYFRRVNGEIEIIRINRDKGNEYSVIAENGEHQKLRKEDLKLYTLLRPDAMVCINEISLRGDFKDILVTVHHKNNKSNIPNVVCRQNIMDVFSNNYIRDDKTYIGVSVSDKTCPVEYDIKSFLECDKIINNDIIATYRNDTLNIILSFINTSKYNRVFDELKSNTKDEVIYGLSDSLHSLLEVNDFMFDYYSIFNIFKVDYDLNINVVDEKEVIGIISNITKENIIHIDRIAEYDYTINIDNMIRDNVITLFTNSGLYLIAYTTEDIADREYDKVYYDTKNIMNKYKY